MKNTYRVVLVMMLIIALACPLAGAEGLVVPAETKERIIEQYGLNAPPASPVWDWSNVDVGVSGFTDGLLYLCRVIINPLSFMLQEMLYIL